MDRAGHGPFLPLAAALSEPAHAQNPAKAFEIACHQMSDELAGSKIWFEEAIKRIGHLLDAPERMATALLNMGYEDGDRMFLERYIAALNAQAAP
ncbi:hypothetical protein [Deinococcus marmoris]|uniref:hypothetical protein n=1 Tax=Deinococcus marmoris TaxID=249408 RepID=UPI00096A35B7|nr:hypothetical protein [Deinococcus marmoris]